MWVLALLIIPAAFAVLLVLEALEKPLGQAPTDEEPVMPAPLQIPQQRGHRAAINA
jgi:hypothetical protein